MSLHLIEAPLSLAALNRWAEQRKLGRGVFDEGLALHHLLGEAFGAGTVQPFRLLVAPRARSGTFLGYSAASADDLRVAAQAVIAPTTAQVIPLDELRSVPRPETTWRPGMRLGFDLRARPVSRLASEIADPETGKRFSKGAEVDAFLAETLRRDTSRPREAVYLDWLAARLDPCATLEPDSTRMASFRRTRSVRKGRRIEGPDATFHGTLTVRDPEGFARLLTRGVGRHRAYGYGMLLLRPPQGRS